MASTIRNDGLHEKLLPNTATASGSDEPLPTAIPAPQNVQNVSFDETDNAASEPFTKGEQQPNRFRDVPFAILFLIHLIVIAFLAFAWGIPSLADAKDAINGDNNNNNNANNNDDDDEGFYYGFLYFCLSASATSLGIASLGLYVMTLRQVATKLIECSLLFCLGMSAMLAALYAVQGLMVLSMVFLIYFMIGVCYTCCVWNRIPFASANLATAVTAIRANWGVFSIAFGMVFKTVIWSVLWILAMIGVYIHTLSCETITNEQGQEETRCTSALNDGAIFAFLLSYYWTNQVFKNIVHVTVAGVVGTWWFEPIQAASCCSMSVRDSLARSTTYSFGSICLGSLLVALIQVLKHVIHRLRAENRRRGGSAANGILLCVLECIVGCLKDILEYFNKWAYIYVGLYGYDYMTAGKNVISLFKNRGWTAIINDGIVHRTLMMIALIMASITGCLGLLFAQVQPSWVESLAGGSSNKNEEEDNGAVVFISFFIPFIISYAISLVLMSVIASAVDTVVVCFAEAPDEFHNNYPGLSQQMNDAWIKIYPSEFGGFASVPPIPVPQEAVPAANNNRGREPESLVI